MREVVIKQIVEDRRGDVFRVTVIEGADRTVHDVYVAADDYDIIAIAADASGVQGFIRTLFESLLQSDSKESIPSDFDLRDAVAATSLQRD